MAGRAARAGIAIALVDGIGAVETVVVDGT
jgi:hypothetical protein